MFEYAQNKIVLGHWIRGFRLEFNETPTSDRRELSGHDATIERLGAGYAQQHHGIDPYIVICRRATVTNLSAR